MPLRLRVSALGFLPVLIAISMSILLASAVPSPARPSSNYWTVPSYLRKPILKVLSPHRLRPAVRADDSSQQDDDSSKDINADARTTSVPQTATTTDQWTDSANAASTDHNDDATADEPNDSEPKEDQALTAFQQFKLLQLSEVDSGDGDAFEIVPVFDNATLVGPFGRNPNTSDVTVLAKADNRSTWYSDSTVRDRIAFQFRFNTDLPYDIAEPTLKSPPNSGIDAQVIDFQTNIATGTGLFTVIYHCLKGKPGQAVVSMLLPVTTDHNVETAWVKDCGQGRFEHLSFGFSDHEGHFVSFNPDGTFGVDEKKTLEVGPMDKTTEIVVSLSPPSENLEFLDPFVTSDSPSVGLQIRGTVSTGTFNGDVDTKFSVIQNCEGQVSADIKFTVAIPPWDNLTATWRKDCGGSVSQALLIGTDGSESYDVMQEGKLLAEYDVADDSTLSNVGSAVALIGPDSQSQMFYFTNSDGTSDIHFQTITTTMSNPDVLDTIMGDGGPASLKANGGIVERDDMRSLLLYFVCKKEGRSVVLVTLPTIRYANVEFGFVKECDGTPMAHYHSGFLQTAGSLMDVVLVLAIVAGLALCVYTVRKRAEGSRYEAVAVSEDAA